VEESAGITQQDLFSAVFVARKISSFDRTGAKEDSRDSEAHNNDDFTTPR